MTNQHPITPPPELIAKWANSMCGYHEAARWGADQELEACCALAEIDPGCGTKFQRKNLVLKLMAARRPKPTSLKEQALRAARIELSENGKNAALIIRALEALPD